MTNTRGYVGVALPAIAAWWVLLSMDSRRPDRLHLELVCSTDSIGVFNSGCVVSDSEEPIVHAPLAILPDSDPVRLKVPLPTAGLQRVVMRLPQYCSYFDIHAITLRRTGSWLWPDRVLARVPLQAVESMGGIQSRAPTADSAMRFTSGTDLYAHLQIRDTTGLVPEPGFDSFRPHLQRTVTALLLGMVWLPAWRRRALWMRLAASPGFVIGVLAAAFCLLLRSTLAIPPPTLGIDELSYMQAAYGTPLIPAPPGYARIGWELPNLLYTALGRGAFALSERGDTWVTGVQVLLYVLSCGMLWGLARGVSTRAWANAAAVFAVLFGTRCYAGLFMPETLYGFLFTALAAGWCLEFPRRPAGAAILAGFLCAALYFVKPHALALLGAMTLCCLLAPWATARPSMTAAAKAGRSLIITGLFALSTAGFAWLFSAILSPLKSGSKAVYGLADYSMILALMKSPGPDAWRLVGHYLELAAAQLHLALPYLALPSYVAYRGWRNSRASNGVRAARYRMLVLFAACSLLATYVMTVHYTVKAGEHAVASENPDGDIQFRAHGRYYSFTFPLFFILLAAGLHRDKKDRRVGWGPPLAAVTAAGILGMLLIGWALPKAAVVWYDSPAYYGLTTQTGRGLALACLLLQAAAAGSPRRRGLARISVCALMLYAAYNSNLASRAAREWNFRQRPHSTAGARFAQIVPESERPHTVVVSSLPEELPYFIYTFRYSPVTPRPEGSFVPDPADLPTESRWLVTYHPENPRAAIHERLSWVSDCMGYRLYAIQEPSR